MRQPYDLSRLEWKLTGWHPNYWKMGSKPDIPAIPARVPGSVQKALLDASLIPDWNFGVNSRQCEWVENRDWMFEAELPAEWISKGARALLKCEGLDYQGAVLVNGRQAGRFRNALVPHVFDLTRYLTAKSNRIAVVFTEIPRYLGQIGCTSKMRDWKPRFNYIWDWVPRIVQIGVWDAIRLEVQQGDAIVGFSLYSDYDHRAKRGNLTISAALAPGQAERAEITIEGSEGEVLRQSFAASADFSCRLDGLAVQPWHPNGNGEQRLYTVRLRLLAADGTALDEETRTVGFRRIVWKPCAGAPPDAEPWLCEINGVDTFLQGVNWVPPRAVFADVTEEDYRVRLQLYQEMGCNVLRVWGGSVLERESFYSLCDQLGIMVWQEFPLSSSGLENRPPDTAQFIGNLKEIAASYITRRRHHTSLLLWSGGNELEGYQRGRKRPGFLKPADVSYPTIAALRDAVRELDPTRRFIPTSPSGPRFSASAGDFGKGVHHDVHGPWKMDGTLDEWRKYWDGDDALFRSETGMPGAGPADLIRRYGGDMALPGDSSNPFWMHTNGWWIQWPDYLNEGGDPSNLEMYVEWSQARQAKALAYAARACKNRFPRCGGFIIWMGHDCYPCPVNTAVVDFLGRPKRAAVALAEVFRSRPAVPGHPANEPAPP
jgi:beta-mannosidase